MEGAAADRCSAHTPEHPAAHCSSVFQPRNTALPPTQALATPQPQCRQRQVQGAAHEPASFSSSMSREKAPVPTGTSWPMRMFSLTPAMMSFSA